jgi:phenylpropionate dioxygenase-like ring-hydroxylating dioxygenase large terminal subunit
VIRDREGTLRAMPNVCQHRASRVVRGDTGHCSSTIKCPYHGWTYDFDGSLRGVPEEDSFRNLDRSSRGLPAIELEEWMGFVFVRFGGKGPSVADSMQPFAEEAGHYRLSELKPWGARSSTEHDFNWKVFAENDAEGYHIPVAHPGLRRLFGSSYRDSVLDLEHDSRGSRSFSALQEKISSNWTESHYQRLLPAVEQLPEDLQRAWIYYGIHPTTVIQISPDLVECYSVLPMGPDRCKLVGFTLAHEDERREMKAARYLNSRIVRQVLEEDLDICHSVDEGIRSDSYSSGGLSTLESGVAQFHQRIRELIPVASCHERPQLGEVAVRNNEMRLQVG